jgi:Uma2 family endonuclease
VPDISVIGWEHIPRNPDGTVTNIFAIAPDWTIEIFDDSDRQLLIPKFAEGIQLRVGELFDWLAE